MVFHCCRMFRCFNIVGYKVCDEYLVTIIVDWLYVFIYIYIFFINEENLDLFIVFLLMNEIIVRLV